MKTQITILSASRGTNAVELAFTLPNSEEVLTSVVTGEIFESVLNGAELEAIPETFRKLTGAKILAVVEHAVAGETFTKNDGTTDVYKTNHVRLSKMQILNGQEIYDKLDLKSIEKDAIIAASKKVVFTPKNVIGRSLIPQKPVVQDSAVEESAPEPVATKKASEKVLETATK